MRIPHSHKIRFDIIERSVSRDLQVVSEPLEPISRLGVILKIQDFCYFWVGVLRVLHRIHLVFLKNWYILVFSFRKKIVTGLNIIF